MDQVLIEEFIPFGYKNRISRPMLQNIMHIPDRAIRKQIEEAAERGVLIASCNGGYFQRQSAEDDPYIEEYIAKERSRLRSQCRKMNALRHAWEGINDNQESLF